MESTNKKRTVRGAFPGALVSEQTRRRIFARCRELGIDDDLRRAIQRDLTGKESLTQFTEAEGQKMLAHLLSVATPSSKRPLRKRWTRPDGIVEIHVVPTITQPQIRKTYALIHQVYDLEREEQARGLSGTREIWTEDLRARLDGWARKITNNEALQLGEIMKEEASNLIEILKDRVEWLKKRIPATRS
ncbi:MAG: DUF1018 domain-containing protein [Candidatus Lindowbacteria bacterium]|nr:DUF1018 domain-containing protein [Candidatus Lindowbacteria bacterium]